MTVSAATPISSAAATASTASATSAQASATPTLSYNSFLTLLMAELKNQDPTQPMDPSQMVSQLATISEVGQAVQTNTSLSSLLTSTSLTQAEQLIGKSITSADGATSGQVTSVTVNGSGATAILSTGQQVPLTNGATVGS
jgi:flagellar basal-body rod modification protein FlgD